VSAKASLVVQEPLLDILANAACEVGDGEEEVLLPEETEEVELELGLHKEKDEDEERDGVAWLLDLLGKTRVPTEDEQLGYLGLARLGREAAKALEERTGIPAASWRAHARHKLLDRKPPSFLEGLEREVPKEARHLYHQLLQGEEGTLKIVEGNLRLVFYVAKRYNLKGNFSLNDLVSEGVSGLYEAVDRFDPKLGYRFSTYAYWWIRQRVARAAKTLGENRELHLEEPVGEEAVLGDFIAAGSEPAERALGLAERERLQRAIARALTPLQAAVVFLKYGLATDEPSPNKVVAQALGLSPAEVADALREAEKRLRFALKGELGFLA